MSRSDRGSKRPSWLRIPYYEHIDKVGENEKVQTKIQER